VLMRMRHKHNNAQQLEGCHQAHSTAGMMLAVVACQSRTKTVLNNKPSCKTARPALPACQRGTLPAQFCRLLQQLTTAHLLSFLGEPLCAQCTAGKDSPNPCPNTVLTHSQQCAGLAIQRHKAGSSASICPPHPARGAGQTAQQSGYVPTRRRRRLCINANATHSSDYNNRSARCSTL
jgi:hypothetical protein